MFKYFPLSSFCKISEPKRFGPESVLLGKVQENAFVATNNSLRSDKAVHLLMAVQIPGILSLLRPCFTYTLL